MRSVPIEVANGHVTLQERTLPGFRVSAIRFPRDYSIGRHHHPRACISVILDGYFVQRIRNREIRCPPGGVLCKPPGEGHEDFWPTEAYHLVLEPEPGGRHAEMFSELTAGVEHSVTPTAAALARTVVRELAIGDDTSDLAIEGTVLQLLAVLRRSEPANERRPAWLSKVEEKLRDDFGEMPTLDELAEIAGVHPSHVSRTFRRAHGKSIGQYLRSLRLEAARKQLVESDLPLSRVAVRTGFSDQSHLTRCLKEATGFTPAVYRRAHRRVN